MQTRNEALYNLAQENEIFVFFRYLPRVAYAVCKNDSLWRGVGAKPALLYDVAMNLSIKQYFGRSLRRSMGLIRLMKRAFWLDFRVLCFKTLDNYLNNALMKPYLDEIVRLTASPLKYVEKYFATDKTGERTHTRSSWYMIRCSKEVRKRDHLNVHITVGCCLHPVVAFTALVEKGKDNVVFRRHVQQVARDFVAQVHTGDSVYLSRENCTAVEEVNAKPRFHLKKGLTKKPKGHPAWKRMLNSAEQNPELYDREYHTRSNVESTNKAKKQKFGDYVLCKNDTAKEQESELTWCAYNFTVLGRAYYELGIEPNEW